VRPHAEQPGIAGGGLERTFEVPLRHAEGGAHGPPDCDSGGGIRRIEGDSVPHGLIERLTPAAAFPALPDLAQQPYPRHQVDVVVDRVRRPAHAPGEVSHGQRGRLGELTEDLEAERGGERIALLAAHAWAGTTGHEEILGQRLKIVKIF
jgi:hypothetical protein